ncbi:hypothetical protein BDZ88DRAFT_237497 [Geranomyces variabilis]|nr:hypothetical protein BDZ88DRAFT_237497 [Geranomyces variabilis]
MLRYRSWSQRGIYALPLLGVFLFSLRTQRLHSRPSVYGTATFFRVSVIRPSVSCGYFWTNVKLRLFAVRIGNKSVTSVAASRIVRMTHDGTGSSMMCLGWRFLKLPYQALARPQNSGRNGVLHQP